MTARAPDLARLGDRLGRTITGAVTLTGGDLSEVAQIDFADGGQAVLKTGPMVAVEGRMLRALADAGAPAPQVLLAEGTMLVMAHVPAGHPGPGAWERLGAQLAAMHAQTGPRYGWPEDYAFGPVAIPGTAPATDWPGFWAEARLRQGIDTLPSRLARRIDALCARLPDLVERDPPASLLHGDLWQGNLLFDPHGAAWLIDPACAWGDAEVDLAMLHLFGRPGDGFETGYGALPPGWEQRRALYQLWPALVHLRLFGASYAPMVEGLLGRLDV